MEWSVQSTENTVGIQNELLTMRKRIYRVWWDWCCFSLGGWTKALKIKARDSPQSVLLCLKVVLVLIKDVITHLKPDILECKVKWALGSIITNKASGGNGISVELFQILKDDAVKVLHSICQHIWKTQQWPQDWKRPVFVPIPKKGNAKECSNCCTIPLISHASKAMFKILQARLQQYVNHELPDVQVGI